MCEEAEHHQGEYLRTAVAPRRGSDALEARERDLRDTATAAELRDHAAASRDRAADERDRAADQRDAEADLRDARFSAGEVDVQDLLSRALARDKRAETRDRAAEARDAMSLADPPSALLRFGAVDRLESGMDRDLAAGDRADLLALRHRAAEVQGTAVGARQDAALDRVQSGADRMDAGADRDAAQRDRDERAR